MAAKLVSKKKVKDYLRNRRSQYLNFLNRIKNEFELFKNRQESGNKIYKVYSRGERQGGEEFKKVTKIVDKVNNYRRNIWYINYEDKKGKIKKRKREADPKFPIQKLGDIVGITIVCVFPGDKQIVDEMIYRYAGQKLYKVIEKEPKISEGYYAVHYILGKPSGAELRIEVQVKTLLHDAWGAMTHDLTYKPQIRIDDERFKHQINMLGDSLQLINKQSEIVGDFIKEQWNLDYKRKEVAKKELFSEMVHDQRPKVAAKAKKYELILSILKKNQELFSKCDYNAPKLKRVLREIKNFVGKDSHTYSSCRMLAYLAILNPNNRELYYMVLDAVDNWIDNSVSSVDTNRAYIFKSLVFYSFNEYDEAIETCKIAKKSAIKSKDKIHELMAMSNLAYYLTEIAGNTDLEKKHKAPKVALKSINKAFKLLESVKKASISDEDKLEHFELAMTDTLGATLIAYGEKEKDIYEGCKTCCETAEKRKGREAAQLYCKIHQRRAFRRLLHYQ